MQELPPFVSHGSPNAYTNYNCRCELCKEGHAAYRSERRLLNREKHNAYMKLYMRDYRAGIRRGRIKKAK